MIEAIVRWLFTADWGLLVLISLILCYGITDFFFPKGGRV